LPILTVIAGPNGSGKRTLIRSLPFACRENLLEPDAIATRIAPHDPAGGALAAGPVFLDKRGISLANGIDFAVETTLAGAGILSLMKRGKAGTPNSASNVSASALRWADISCLLTMCAAGIFAF
jgi:predicted ABC-type ATPase